MKKVVSNKSFRLFFVLTLILNFTFVLNLSATVMLAGPDAKLSKWVLDKKNKIIVVTICSRGIENDCLGAQRRFFLDDIKRSFFNVLKNSFSSANNDNELSPFTKSELLHVGAKKLTEEEILEIQKQITYLDDFIAKYGPDSIDKNRYSSLKLQLQLNGKIDIANEKYEKLVESILTKIVDPSINYDFFYGNQDQVTNFEVYLLRKFLNLHYYVGWYYPSCGLGPNKNLQKRREDCSLIYPQDQITPFKVLLSEGRMDRIFLHDSSRKLIYFTGRTSTLHPADDQIDSICSKIMAPLLTKPPYYFDLKLNWKLLSVKDFQNLSQDIIKQVKFDNEFKYRSHFNEPIWTATTNLLGFRYGFIYNNGEINFVQRKFQKNRYNFMDVVCSADL
jgi:hypothetical protein